MRPKQEAEAAEEVAPADERAAAAAPSPGSASGGPVDARGGPGTQSANALAAASAGIEILSPDPAIRWRIAGADRAAFHRWRIDGGTRLPIGATAELVAGAAPSTTVCWLVGRGGVVLRSTDGRTFPASRFRR